MNVSDHSSQSGAGQQTDAGDGLQLPDLFIRTAERCELTLDAQDLSLNISCFVEHCRKCGTQAVRDLIFLVGYG